MRQQAEAKYFLERLCRDVSDVLFVPVVETCCASCVCCNPQASAGVLEYATIRHTLMDNDPSDTAGISQDQIRYMKLL